MRVRVFSLVSKSSNYGLPRDEGTEIEETPEVGDAFYSTGVGAPLNVKSTWHLNLTDGQGTPFSKKKLRVSFTRGRLHCNRDCVLLTRIESYRCPEGAGFQGIQQPAKVGQKATSRGGRPTPRYTNSTKHEAENREGRARHALPSSTQNQGGTDVQPKRYLLAPVLNIEPDSQPHLSKHHQTASPRQVDLTPFAASNQLLHGQATGRVRVNFGIRKRPWRTATQDQPRFAPSCTDLY